MARLDQRISGLESQREWNMAATSEVDALPGGLCPECGSGFARDLKGRRYRGHLEKRPKRDTTGRYRRDKNGMWKCAEALRRPGIVVTVIEGQSNRPLRTSTWHSRP